MTQTFRNFLPTIDARATLYHCGYHRDLLACAVAASVSYVVLRSSKAQSQVHHSDPGQVPHRVIAALQMTFNEEPEESAHPLIPKEPRARQDPFQLLARGLKICWRDGHVFENTSCFQRCANV
jgi:hypothetical protein